MRAPSPAYSTSVHGLEVPNATSPPQPARSTFQIPRPPAAASGWIYQNTPSLQQMENDKRYRKTVKKYRMPLQRGMMVRLEDLEDFPAPILCPFCEVPTISSARSERNAGQW